MPKIHKVAGGGTGAIVDDRIREYRSRARNSNDVDEQQQFHDWLESLEAIGSGLLVQPETQKEVFLSYSYEDEHTREWAERVQKILELADFSVVTGKLPINRSRIAEAVIDSIRRTNAVFGLWTEDRGRGVSPWLHWEMGVAEGHGLPVVVMIHETVVDQAGRVRPEEYYFRFNRETFPTQLKNATHYLRHALTRRNAT